MRLLLSDVSRTISQSVSFFQSVKVPVPAFICVQGFLQQVLPIHRAIYVVNARPRGPELERSFF